jgi:hypothetical protein
MVSSVAAHEARHVPRRQVVEVGAGFPVALHKKPMDEGKVVDQGRTGESTLVFEILQVRPLNGCEGALDRLRRRGDGNASVPELLEERS